jgi:Flp pilus assembly protein TadD
MNTSTAYRLGQEQLDALHRIADSTYQQGKFEEAARFFWFTWLHAPTDARYLKGLGASLFMGHAFEPAAVAYGCLLQIAPLDAEANCMYGHTLLMLGKRDDARRYLQIALKLPNGAADFHVRANALLDLIGR